MTCRWLAWTRRDGVAVGLAVAVVPGFVVYLSAQAQRAGAQAKPAPKPAPASPAAGGSALTTPWGAPNLQGIWISGDLTPVETPDKSDQASLAALSKWFPGNDFTTDRTATTDPVVEYRGPKRQSLITEPASGRLSIKQSAIDERDYNLMHLNDSYVNQTLWERCISRGVPLFPAPYDSAYHILQTPEHIAIFYELLHVPRIIPISNQPHLSPKIRQWVGDSRAHWEGKTLVVDTTNYRDKSILGSATTSRRLRGLPHSESLRTTERFTRTDAGTIQYEVLIQDLKTYDHPWTAKFDLLAPPDSYQLLEVACHEGNLYMSGALRGGRVEDGSLKQLR
jgi:hypothetical protein